MYSVSNGGFFILNYASIIIRQDHPRLKEIIREFSDTVTLLNDKPQQKLHDKFMKMTKEQAYQWLREVKQNKKNTIDKMTDWLIKDFEKRTGEKPTYIETI